LAVKEIMLWAVKEVPHGPHTRERESECVPYFWLTQDLYIGTFVHWSIRDDIVRCATVNLVVRRGAFYNIIWSASW
jgi:hypothetical protein